MSTQGIVKMRDVKFDPGLFVNYRSGTALDRLLSSYGGLPKGVNYMVIGEATRASARRPSCSTCSPACTTVIPPCASSLSVQR